MNELSDAELARLLADANAWRRSAPADRDVAAESSLQPIGASGSTADALLDRRYHHSIHLAVYGSLAPGKENHHVLARFPGPWIRGRVRGDVINAGWGATRGFPGLVPRADGAWVPVHVLESTALPNGWREIDEFEGVEYRRILIPIYAEDAGASLVTVANIYEIAH